MLKIHMNCTFKIHMQCSDLSTYTYAEFRFNCVHMSNDDLKNSSSKQ